MKISKELADILGVKEVFNPYRETMGYLEFMCVFRHVAQSARFVKNQVPGAFIAQTSANVNADEVSCSSPDITFLPKLPANESESHFFHILF